MKIKHLMVTILHPGRPIGQKKFPSDKYLLNWFENGDIIPHGYPISAKLAKALIAGGMPHGD